MNFYHLLGLGTEPGVLKFVSYFLRLYHLATGDALSKGN
jgi:hypothetical protein